MGNDLLTKLLKSLHRVIESSTSYHPSSLTFAYETLTILCCNLQPGASYYVRDIQMLSLSFVYCFDIKGNLRLEFGRVSLHRTCVVVVVVVYVWFSVVIQ